MPASIRKSNGAESGGGPYKLRRILVAHDNSYAATRAMEDAESFARRFHSEIILVRVISAGEDLSSATLSAERKEAVADLEVLVDGLVSKGIASRYVLRVGLTGDTLFHVAHQEQANLMMLGAYGLGSQDRQTLGSTAEHLLRAIPCPAMTYGPHASSGLLARLEGSSSLLVAVPLPFQKDWLEPAIEFAQLFGKGIELVHVTQTSRQCQEDSRSSQECEDLAGWVRQHGIAANWTVFVGVPAIFLHACAEERKSPLVVLPLQRRDRLSSITSDNVAAQVIRCSSVPILSYRID